MRSWAEEGPIIPMGGSGFWAGGKVSQLTNASYGGAYAINKGGEVAGVGGFTGTYEGFLWTPSKPDGSTGTFTTVYSVGGTNYTGSGVTYNLNDSGVAVGYAQYDAGSGYAANGYIWDGNTLTDLGANVGPLAINNAGTVVGSIDGYEGFLYRNGALTDLNYFVSPADGPAILYAQDINTSEQIVGSGYLGGNYIDMLMTPVRISSCKSLQRDAWQQRSDRHHQRARVPVRSGSAVERDPAERQSDQLQRPDG